MSDDELTGLRRQAREDRKLFQRAERVLGEIDRATGLSDEQADVLAAVRIRLEGKPRATLDELLGAAGEISGKKDLGDLLPPEPEEGSGKDWPEITEKKRDWPGT